MNKFRLSEKILLIAGLCLFLGSLFVASFHANDFSRMLGLGSGAKRQAAGKVESSENMVRRKFFSESAFLPVEASQIVYSRDSIMTGPNSGLVLALNDGTRLELGPDSLIEIQFSDEAAGIGKLEFLVKVKKGKVSGDSPAQSVKLVENEAVVALPKRVARALPTATPFLISTPLPVVQATPEPTAAEIATPTPVPLEDLCKITKLKASNPFELATPAAFLSGKLNCPPDQKIFKLEIKSARPVRALDLRLRAGSADFKFAVPGPGIYELLNQKITVQARYPLISWSNPPLHCDGLLAYALPKTVATQLRAQVMEDGESKALTEKAWRAQASVPTQISLLLKTSSPYELSSPPIKLQNWRECPSLKNPAQRSALPLRAGMLLFTWVETAGTAYRFEIARDPSFTKPLKSETTTQNFARYRPDQLGTYYWRVRGLKTNDLSDVFTLDIR